MAAVGLAQAGGGAGAAVTGAAAASGWSPWTERVLILRGSLFGIVPLDGVTPGAGRRHRRLVATLDGDGGLAFWFSGGNTTRGPAAAR